MVKSGAWIFFKEGTNTSAICKLWVEAKCSIDKASILRFGGTSHLWRHLDDNHSDDAVRYSLNFSFFY